MILDQESKPDNVVLVYRAKWKPYTPKLDTESEYVWYAMTESGIGDFGITMKRAIKNAIARTKYIFESGLINQNPYLQFANKPDFLIRAIESANSEYWKALRSNV